MSNHDQRLVSTVVFAVSSRYSKVGLHGGSNICGRDFFLGAVEQLLEIIIHVVHLYKFLKIKQLSATAYASIRALLTRRDP